MQGEIRAVYDRMRSIPGGELSANRANRKPGQAANRSHSLCFFFACLTPAFLLKSGLDQGVEDLSYMPFSL
jgi:hypothetical protein